ncbi:MAG: YncE family protein, partial [Methylococcales bacterium]
MNCFFKPVILGLCLACAFFSEVASSLPRAYIANAADGTVSVIDTGTRTVIATIAVGSNPTHVAVNEQGTRAYVRNGETVSVIDTSNNTVIASPVIPGGVLLLNGD